MLALTSGLMAVRVYMTCQILMPRTLTEYWVRNKQHMLFRLEWTFLEWACSHRPHLQRARVESWKEMGFEMRPT